MPEEGKSKRTLLEEWAFILETHDDGDGRGEIQSADLSYTVALVGLAIIEALGQPQSESSDELRRMQARRGRVAK